MDPMTLMDWAAKNNVLHLKWRCAEEELIVDFVPQPPSGIAPVFGRKPPETKSDAPAKATDPQAPGFDELLFHSA